MATVILSSITNLTEKLATPLRRYLTASPSSLQPPSIVEADLVELKKTLRKIEAVVGDAEKREVKDESVKLWLKELRDVAFDAEDLLDEFEYELLRIGVEAKAHKRKTHKRKQDDVTSPIVFILPSPLDEPAFRDRVATTVKEINARLDEIAREKEALHLREEDASHRVEYKMRPMTSSYVDQSEVYGRDEACSLLVEHLLKNDGDEQTSVSVIPIVGMPGVGKTTLTQLIYNHSSVCENFELRVWVYVSQDFHVARLVKVLIESITKSLCSVDELDELQDCLKSLLQEKRFLIVLDDVWNEEQILWDKLSSLLCSGVGGCRVIVTTRNESVAKIVQANMPVCRLNCLSDDDCWKIFRRQAFGGGEVDLDAFPAGLVEIGKMIADKCKGLPLAAKVLGSLLRCETDQEVWTDVLESDLWDIDETGGDEILPAVKLSYQHLPVHLKRCFVYCSVFPKNFMFKRSQLIPLWMVQGLIHHQTEQHEEPEDAGFDYFEDLISRSFFQKAEIDIGEEHMFMMHDLVHDLARNLSSGECHTTEFTNLSSVSVMVRHASVSSYSSQNVMQFQSAEKLTALRSLLVVHRLINQWGGVGIWLDKDFLHVKIPNDVFASLKCLRALDLSYTDIKALPDSIVGLKLLRYLSLRNTKIQKLPESVCKLYKLQTLDLDYCRRLKELPRGIGNLLNLRHVDLPTMDSSFICIPSGIASLTGLQELAAFNVGADSSHCSIGELKLLINLSGDLYISGLRNVARGWFAKEANMESKKSIQRLTLDWYVHQSNYKCSHNLNISASKSKSDNAIALPWTQVEEEEAVLKNLRPNKDLVVLEIRQYGGTKFPHWLGDPSFAKLVTVRLFQCNQCKVLPSLGDLPSLKKLMIEGMESLQSIGPEFSGTKSFPALETLKFTWIPELEEWSEAVFPQLTELDIMTCHKLKKVPKCLAPALKKLDISECEKVTELPASESLASLGIVGEFQEDIWTYIASLTQLNSLEISFCNSLTCLPLHNMPSLSSLKIESCSELVSIDCHSCSGTVSAADVASSSSSSALVKDDVGLHNLVSLEKLTLEECPKLRFSEDEQLPSTLKSIEISGCKSLMDWCLGDKGQSQLPLVPEVFIADFDAEEFQEMIKEEMGSEEDMDEEEVDAEDMDED
ncbi:P-loop containing nucleoside triphosphate hydrolase protein [Dioscorea alata]|uniref:P-loop containing nucleoside triphosphate hydrolase protein n=1 Tax=Dioscorea alata TaxID=55571 RepID=A0ACB7VSZ1_DIOAL|nr:P-loop containing nucleoside triphosphate hydrolase protein [Dioscorea alata]